MRVFIDARLSGHGGIGRYSSCLVRALLDCADAPTMTVLTPHSSHHLVNPPPNVKFTEALSDRYTVSELLELSLRTAVPHYDMFHSLNYLASPTSLPSIVTVHDVMRLRMPEYCHSNTEFIRRFGITRFISLCAVTLAIFRTQALDPRNFGKFQSQPLTDSVAFYGPEHEALPAKFKVHHAYLSGVLYWSVIHARAVVTVSRFSKAEITSTLGIDPAKVHVIYPGVAPAFVRVNDTREIDAVKAKYSIPADYFLHVGLKRRHKNLSLLIQAYSILVSLDPNPPLLVFVGTRDEDADHLLALTKSAGTNRKVIFIGEVADHDLNLLYNGAAAVVVPSLYEGFGFPAVEAMACGAPVIASHIPSLSEVVGDAAFLVDPHDPQEWAAALRAVWSNNSLRVQLIDRAERLVQRYDWRNAAARVIELYSSM